MKLSSIIKSNPISFMKTIVLMILISLYSCVGTDHKYKILNNTKNVDASDKPKNISDKAFWVGGADGGNWYLVDSINKSRKEASIKVYNDYTGELIVSKTFKMKCINDDGINWDNLREQINAFDGEKIQLEIKGKGGTSRYCYFE